MKYEGDVYRPPSEARSLLVQVTLGCAWNQCTFCYMYKNKPFKVRRMEDIEADLLEGAEYAGRFKRIFLCDGNALALATDKLVHILERIRQLYPHIEDVRAYASSKDINRKSVGELARLRQLGLGMVYTGLESGDDAILKKIHKGETKAEMVAAAQKLHTAGIVQSVSIISGLGGEDHWREHMTETAVALNQMQPEYVGLLALMPPEDAGYPDNTEGGPLRSPTPLQALEEMRLLVEGFELEDCLFSSAHASNFDHIKGHLPEDKEKLLGRIDSLIEATRARGGRPASTYRQL